MGGPLLQPLQSWSDHTLPVTCLAVGAGDAGAVVASGSLDRTVKVRSLVAGAGGGAGPLLRSVPLPAAVRSLALDPGEHALYAGCTSGAIYEVPLVGAAAAAAGLGSDAAAAGGGAGAALPTLEGHSQAVTSLALSPDAAYLVSGSEDASVRVWELRSRQQVRALQNAARGPVSAVLALAQPPHMLVGGGHAASAGGGGSGRRGPKRPQPLAPFNKYPNAPGALQPWEGGLVLLDGSAAAAAAVAPVDWPASSLLGASSAAFPGSSPADASAPAASAVAAAGGAAASTSGGAADAAALQEENQRLREQLDRALATVQQWGHLNTQLQQICAERLLAANGQQ